MISLSLDHSFKCFEGSDDSCSSDKHQEGSEVSADLNSWVVVVVSMVKRAAEYREIEEDKGSGSDLSQSQST